MAYLISELGPPKGFHPISSTTIYLPGIHKAYEFCSLYIHHTLPPLVFVDTHELAQRNESYTFSHWGSRDLEKPVHALPDKVSELLLNVRFPNLETQTGHPLNEGQEEGRTVQVDVPMHLRYGSPRTASSSSSEEDQTGAYERIRVDWPQGFLSCPPSSRAITKNKAKSVSLPKHVLSVLPSDNVLVAIPPHSDFANTSTVLYLPLGNTRDVAFVEPLTALTILACCFWLFRVANKTARRLNANAQPTQRPKTS
ncbi:hypothetical protein CVT25_011654 [Psilocybe cyanescens]|uniref:Protein PBN1 n=1 Tax=Psilocybe cyanescens TaxID=93625 RepID=A0A409XWK1_PSICY|nr:hypothetical protein CVT25_011654 [Psilocybe cyanescens]